MSENPIEGHVIDPGFEDYWSVETTERYTLPDGKQFFEIKPLNEGMRKEYEKRTNKGFRMNQRSGEAHMDIDPAGNRWELIKASVVDFYLMQKGRDNQWSQYPFSTRNVEEWLKLAPPKIVDGLETFIRKCNPWMMESLTVDDIDEQIEDLHKLRAEAVAREAGESGSATK